MSCICECGCKKDIELYSIRSGRATSCGCYQTPGQVTDWIGKKFGNWTIIEDGGYRHYTSSLGKKSRHKMALCQCKCGSQHRVLIANLLKGNSVSCGCINKLDLMGMVGRRFGKIVVIGQGDTIIRRYGGMPRKVRTVQCECDCGVIKDLSAKAVLVGDYKSCGCVHYNRRQLNVPSGKKRCSMCGKIYDISEFRLLSFKNNGRIGSRIARCNNCDSKYRHSRHIRSQYHRSHLWYKYGLTPLDYSKIGNKQSWRCAICNHKILDCKKLWENTCHNYGGGFDKKSRVSMAHIDHEHINGKTGKEHVRGMLCHSCNIGLGGFKDSIQNLESAIKYLKAYDSRKTQETKPD